ncbi:MAG: hypothetical protein LBB75_01655 [Oscillospiraceae bacterium]|jgi:hypothetical protein|nr:hypothetical protein [Oscillospiraceae bacterium]
MLCNRYRDGYWEGYYRSRLRTEAWLCDAFAARIEARGRAMLFALFGNGDAAAFAASVPEAFGQPGGYIEAQVWSDIYFA